MVGNGMKPPASGCTSKTTPSAAVKLVGPYIASGGRTVMANDCVVVPAAFVAVMVTGLNCPTLASVAGFPTIVPVPSPLSVNVKLSGRVPRR